ncbi:unnamed protein product [Hanseniaspora opuntiae]
MDNSKITPEALQYLKELTAQKKKDDLKAVIKIDFSYIILSIISCYLLYRRSATKGNHLTKFFICNIYTMFVVKNQMSANPKYLTRIYRLTTFLSLIANMVTYIWGNFYTWATLIALYLAYGFFSIIKNLLNFKNNLPLGKSYDHLNQPKQAQPTLMDSFSSPLQQMKQQENQEKAKRSLRNDENVVYKSSNGMKIPQNMSKGMKAALKMKDQNGNDIQNDEPLSKRQMKLKKKFEKMQKMNSNQGGVRH